MSNAKVHIVNPDKSQQKQEEVVRRFAVLTARAAHEVNRAYCRFLGDESQKPWDEAPDWQKASVLTGVIAIMRNSQLTPAQLHSCWMALKLKDGWVHGETKDEAAKTHPCIVPYDELPENQRLKDVLFGAVVRASLGISQ